MGRRGPKPKPTLLTLHSGKGAASAPTGPDAAPPAVVAAAGVIAVETWDRTVTSLRALGVWHEADRAAVGRYAALTAMHDQCLEAVRKDGPTVRTSSGYVTPSPDSTMLLKVAAALLALEGALGLSPRTRNRMKAETVIDTSWLDEFNSRYPVT
jgi:P27 family predicted phage terminase small subunit